MVEPEAPHGAETIGTCRSVTRHAPAPLGARGALAMPPGSCRALDVATSRRTWQARPYGALRSLRAALLSPMSGAERPAR